MNDETWYRDRKGALKDEVQMTKIQNMRCSILSCFVLCICLTACAPKPTTTTTGPLTPPAPPDPILLYTDPTALRMQDIAAAMNAYLSTNHDLPLSLSMLQPAAARFGLTLDFISPTSGKPYIYVPNAPTISGIPLRLVLYDATPAHGGYWAVMLLPAQATQPLQAEVFHLTPDLLQLYLKSANSY